MMERRDWLGAVGQDIRYALRSLSGQKMFALTALLTIAIGIGSATFMFGVVNAVILRPLPYSEAPRTLVVFNSYREKGLDQASMSPPEFVDIIKRANSFDAFAAMAPQDMALTGTCASADCEPERVKAYVVSPETFRLLGVSPVRGRDFARADGVTGAEKVVILSDRLWRNRYGADPGLIGRSITLGGVPRLVIAVMPPSVRFPDDPVTYMKDPADLWVPVSWEQRSDSRGNQYLVVLARVRSGLSTQQASADLAAIGETFKAEFPDRYAEPRAHWKLGSRPLREEMIGNVRPTLNGLFAAVACVLLIACVNVAHLMLTRGSARRRELALRAALGADRRRLVTQLILETFILVGSGALFGLAAAAGSLKLLAATNPAGIPHITDASVDGTVIAFATVAALVSTLIAGVGPALGQTALPVNRMLGDGARGGDSAGPRSRSRRLLVIGEVATAMVVLVAASLLVRTYTALSRVPLGFDLSRAAVAKVNLPMATYGAPAKVQSFQASVVEQLRSIPGIRHASAVFPLPMSGESWSGSIAIANQQRAEGQPPPHAEYAVAMPGYFETVGIPILEGRDFSDADIATSTPVVIVDTEFAREIWPGESPLGKRVATGGDAVNGPFQTVVGVVGHVRNKGARGSSEGQLYLAAMQRTPMTLYYLSDAAAGAGELTQAMRAKIRNSDNSLPVTLLATGQSLTAQSNARDRFAMALFALFGVTAVFMAGVGLYGVLALMVSLRRGEIGIRLALGGRPIQIVRGILGEAVGLTLVGLALGIGMALLATKMMVSLLFSVSHTDATAYASASIVMAVVAIIAALSPALKAARVDPVETLRG